MILLKALPRLMSVETIENTTKRPFMSRYLKKKKLGFKRIASPSSLKIKTIKSLIYSALPFGSPSIVYKYNSHIQFMN